MGAGWAAGGSGTTMSVALLPHVPAVWVHTALCEMLECLYAICLGLCRDVLQPGLIGRLSAQAAWRMKSKGSQEASHGTARMLRALHRGGGQANAMKGEKRGSARDWRGRVEEGGRKGGRKGCWLPRVASAL